jgi:hypothetical protein
LLDPERYGLGLQLAAVAPGDGSMRVGSYVLPTVVAAALGFLLAASMAYAAKGDQLPPMLVDVYPKPVVDVLVSGDRLIFASVDGARTYIVVARVYPYAPVPKLEIINRIAVPEPPAKLLVDSYASPHYVFALLPPQSILIWDLEDNTSVIFDTSYSVREIAYVNLGGSPAIVALTENGHLFAVVRGKLGWYEAGDLVGSLLRDRSEGVIVERLVQVWNASGMPDLAGLALLKMSILPSYVPVARLLVRVTYNSTPVKGALVYGYYQGEFTYIEETNARGEALLGLPWLPPALNVIVGYNGSCWLFKVDMKDTIKAGEVLEYTRPLEILNATQIACIEPRAETQYYLLGYTYPPTRLALNASNIAESAEPVAVFIVNNTIHVWYSAKVQNKHLIHDEVYSLETGDMLRYAFYNIGFDSLTSVTASAGGLVSVASTKGGQLFILNITRANDTYSLLWSFHLSGAKRTMVARRNITFILLALAGESKLMLVKLAPFNNTVKIESVGAKGESSVELSFKAYTFSGVPNLTYIAFASPSGLYILRGAWKLIVGAEVTAQLLKNYTLTNETLRIVNEDGETVDSVRVTGVLTYGNITLTEFNATPVNGVIEVPCMPIAKLKLSISPLGNYSAIYRGVSVEVDCASLPGNRTIVIPYQLYNVTVAFTDSYTRGAPERNLTLTVRDLKRNMTMAVSVGAGQHSVTLDNLKPGIYSLRVSDGSLYRTATITFRVPETLRVNVTLERIPVRVIVYVKPTAIPKEPEPVRVEVLAASGDRLYTASFTPRKAGERYAVAFVTPYRGPALVKVYSTPHSGAAFYAPAEVRMTVTDGGGVASVVLRPNLLTVHIAVKGETVNGTLTAVPATLTILAPNGSRIVLPANGTVSLKLWKGTYNYTLTPAAYDNTSFSLFSPAAGAFTVDADGKTVSIVVKQVRVPTNVLVVDRIAIGGYIADKLTVMLDGREVATIPPGKPRKIVLPIHVNGSIVEIKSAGKVYMPFKKKVEPSNKTVMLRIARKAVSLNINVYDEFGKPLGSATVTIRGIDVALSTTLVTSPDGTINAVLPLKGNYQICAKKVGYYESCTTMLVSGQGLNIKLTLRPTLRTLILEKYLNIIVGVVAAAIVVVLIKHYLTKLAEKIAAEEEF